VYELILRHASDLAEKIAFADADGAVSYGELARRTAWVAGNLRVERGSRVALYLTGGVSAISATLGVSRAAAVGVPLARASATTASGSDWRTAARGWWSPTAPTWRRSGGWPEPGW
jgi:acyl-CoA synthetase (AMP-forming)/AMP-acid ligase II